MLSRASNIAEQVNTAFLAIAGLCVLLFVIVVSLMIVFVVKYHRTKNPEPTDIEGNTLLEIVWTVVPIVVVLAMFYYGWVGYKVMKDVPSDAATVRVYGRMWSWLFQYENGVQSEVLKLPAGKPVKLLLTSTDVLHSFYVPAFRVKQDLVPGMENYIWFTPQDTGSYDVFCAEYCGQQHAYMHSKVEVLPPEDFERWMEEESKSLAEVQVARGEEGGEEELKKLRLAGAKLVKRRGCTACHSLDGKQLIGPTFKGIYGRRTVVVAGGVEKEVLVDEEYMRRSMLEPQAEIVKGYQPIMPSQKGIITEGEMEAIIEYLKGVK